MTENNELPPLPPAPHRFAVELTPTGKRLDYTADDMHAYARAALAQRQGEPVAWIWKYANGEEEVVFLDASKHTLDPDEVDCPSTITPLFTHPAPATAEQPAEPNREPNNEEVICPACTHQFRAIPVQVQRLLLDAGIEPPFLAATAPAPVAREPSDPVTDACLLPTTIRRRIDAAAYIMSHVMAFRDLGVDAHQFERALEGLRALQANDTTPKDQA